MGLYKRHKATEADHIQPSMDLMIDPMITAGKKYQHISTRTLGWAKVGGTRTEVWWGRGFQDPAQPGQPYNEGYHHKMITYYPNEATNINKCH